MIEVISATDVAPNPVFRFDLSTEAFTEALETGLSEIEATIWGKRATEIGGRVSLQDINLSEGKPLLTAEQTAQLLGYNAGELVGAVRLPYNNKYFEATYLEGTVDSGKRQMPVLYCFRTSERPAGRHAIDANAQYSILTIDQIRQYSSAYNLGEPALSEIRNGLIELKPGQEQVIGKHHWLPVVGVDISLSDIEAGYYSTISREQGTFSVTEAGQLHYKSLAKNPTQIY